MRRLALIAVMVPLVGCSSPDSETVCYDDLIPGPAVSCDDPHYWEEIGATDFSNLFGAVYPPVRAQITGFDETGIGCSILADDLVGNQENLRGTGLPFAYPSPEDWDRGDMTAECLGGVELVTDEPPALGDHQPIRGTGGLVEGTWKPLP